MGKYLRYNLIVNSNPYIILPRKGFSDNVRIFVNY